MNEQFWYHERTGTFGFTCGDFIEFEFGGRIEESYWPILKEEGEWVYIGEIEGDEK